MNYYFINMFSVKIVQLLYVFINFYYCYDVKKKIKDEYCPRYNEIIQEYINKITANYHFFLKATDKNQLCVLVKDISIYLRENSLNMNFIRFDSYKFYRNEEHISIFATIKDYFPKILKENIKVTNLKSKNSCNFYNIAITDNQNINWIETNYSNIIDGKDYNITQDKSCKTENNSNTDVKDIKILILMGDDFEINELSADIIAKSLTHEIKKYHENPDLKAKKDRFYLIGFFNSNYNDYCLKNINHYRILNIFLRFEQNDSSFIFFGNNEYKKNVCTFKTFSLKYKNGVLKLEKNKNLKNLKEFIETTNKKSTTLKKNKKNTKLEIILQNEEFSRSFTFNINIVDFNNKKNDQIKLVKTNNELIQTFQYINLIKNQYMYSAKKKIEAEDLSPFEFECYKTIENKFNNNFIDYSSFLDYFWQTFINSKIFHSDSISCNNIYLFKDGFISSEIDPQILKSKKLNLANYDYDYSNECKDVLIDKNIISFSENIFISKIEIFFEFIVKKKSKKGLLLKIMNYEETIILNRWHSIKLIFKEELHFIVNSKISDPSHGIQINKNDYEKIHIFFNRFIKNNQSSKILAKKDKSIEITYLDVLFSENILIGSINKVPPTNLVISKNLDLIIIEILKEAKNKEEEEVVKKFLEELKNKCVKKEFENKMNKHADIIFFGDKKFMENREIKEFIDELDCKLKKYKEEQLDSINIVKNDALSTSSIE